MFIGSVQNISPAFAARIQPQSRTEPPIVQFPRPAAGLEPVKVDHVREAQLWRALGNGFLRDCSGRLTKCPRLLNPDFDLVSSQHEQPPSCMVNRSITALDNSPRAVQLRKSIIKGREAVQNGVMLMSIGAEVNDPTYTKMGQARLVNGLKMLIGMTPRGSKANRNKYLRPLRALLREYKDFLQRCQRATVKSEETLFRRAA